MYIIYSDRLCRYYVGSTKDLESRLLRHQNNHTKSTKGKGPWRLVLIFSFPSRSEAVKMEMKIKKRGAKRFIEDQKQSG